MYKIIIAEGKNGKFKGEVRITQERSVDDKLLIKGYISKDRLGAQVGYFAEISGARVWAKKDEILAMAKKCEALVRQRLEEIANDPSPFVSEKDELLNQLEAEGFRGDLLEY